MSMKIKALWGFVGDTGAVRRGEVIEVSKEYGHALIGKGLAEELAGGKQGNVKKTDEGSGKTEPKTTKPATPAETK